MEHLEKVNILLVDDNRSSMLALEAALEGLGQNLVMAHSGKEALEQILLQDFAVILLDVQMPVMDGYETAELIRQRPANQYTPIIFLTAIDKADANLFKGYSVGAVDYLFKPVNITILRAKVAVFIELAKKTALIQQQTMELVKREAAAQQAAEQKKIEEHLIISDRMVSMGTLAAGIAHEINNPLASVMANLDLATREVAKRVEKLGLSMEFAELQEELNDACQATERIREIVKDLKIFSRFREEKAHPVSIEQVLESTLRMAGNEIRHRACLERDYQNVPFVQASEARLGQVFLNLVINAAQAIPEGDAENNKIRISTRMGTHGSVVVEVSDTGCGMPPDVLEKMFTPFFTTKPIGVGTGLGLSICHKIITQFRGEIDVTSEVGVGTTFRVTLPISHAAGLEKAEPVMLSDSVARRRGKILVVDDDLVIIKAISRTLSAEHEVLALDKAEDALQRINAGERFDVIICDLMMPQMNGMELYSRISEVAPEQASRMIFLTGGAFTLLARDFLRKTPNLCIEKPFDTLYLRRLINERIQ